MNKSLPGAETGASPLGWLIWGASIPWGDCREGFCAGVLGSFSLCRSCAFLCDLSCLCTLGTLLAFIAMWDAYVYRHKGKKQETAEWSSGVLSKNGSEGHSWLFYWIQDSGFLTAQQYLLGGWGTVWNLASGNIRSCFKMWAGVTSGDLHTSAEGHV